MSILRWFLSRTLKVDAVADYSALHRPCRRPALQLEVLFEEVLETFGGACLGGAYLVLRSFLLFSLVFLAATR